MNLINCDILIIGGGAAGLRAAISVRQEGLDALVMSKSAPGKGTCTFFSGGALAGADGTESDHKAQTLAAGRSINQPDLVDVLVKEAPLRLKELMEWGLYGAYQQGYLYAKDQPPVWGREIIRSLIHKNKEMGTRFLGGAIAVDIRLQDGLAAVLAFMPETGQWLTLYARALVLAAGGAGALFARNDNPPRISGDGHWAAFMAGAVLQDMEFMQFYPLGTAESGRPPLLIPPGVADLGRLENEAGDNILEYYGITERPAALKARDKLSQALFKEIDQKGQIVRLDLRHITEEQWQGLDPFSASIRPVLEKRFAAHRRPFAVAPMAHHLMGGLSIDVNGAASLPGLFAAGEVTGGLHGANRMGGNALTETLVFGARAGKAAAAWATQNKASENDLIRSPIPFPAGGNNSAQPGPLMDQLRKIMWENGGIIRNKNGLQNAVVQIGAIQRTAAELSLEKDAKTVGKILELRSAAGVAGLMLQSALMREESRGAHFREDCPDQDDDRWRCHIRVRRNADDEAVWEFSYGGSPYASFSQLSKASTKKSALG